MITSIIVLICSVFVLYAVYRDKNQRTTIYRLESMLEVPKRTTYKVSRANVYGKPHGESYITVHHGSDTTTADIRTRDELTRFLDNGGRFADTQNN